MAPKIPPPPSGSSDSNPIPPVRIIPLVKQTFKKATEFKVSKYIPEYTKTFAKNTGDFVQNNPGPVIAGTGTSVAATHTVVADRKSQNLSRSADSLELAEKVGKSVNISGNFEAALDDLRIQNASVTAFEAFRIEAKIPVGAMEFKQAKSIPAQTALSQLGLHTVICTVDPEVMSKYKHDRTGQHFTINPKARGTRGVKAKVASTTESQRGNEEFSSSQSAGRTNSEKNDSSSPPTGSECYQEIDPSSSSGGFYYPSNNGQSSASTKPSGEALPLRGSFCYARPSYGVNEQGEIAINVNRSPNEYSQQVDPAPVWYEISSPSPTISLITTILVPAFAVGAIVFGILLSIQNRNRKE